METTNAVVKSFLSRMPERLFLSKTMFDLMMELHREQPVLMNLWDRATEQALSNAREAHASEECERHVRLAFLNGFSLGYRVRERLSTK